MQISSLTHQSYWSLTKHWTNKSFFFFTFHQVKRKFWNGKIMPPLDFWETQVRKNKKKRLYFLNLSLRNPTKMGFLKGREKRKKKRSTWGSCGAKGFLVKEFWVAALDWLVKGEAFGMKGKRNGLLRERVVWKEQLNGRRRWWEWWW